MGRCETCRFFHQEKRFIGDKREKGTCSLINASAGFRTTPARIVPVGSSWLEVYKKFGCILHEEFSNAVST